MANCLRVLEPVLPGRSAGRLGSDEFKSLADPLLKCYEEEDHVCRICHENEGLQLLSPCHCTGSVGYICRSCLERFRNMGRDREMRCDLCRFNFFFECEPACRKDLLVILLRLSWRAVILSISSAVSIIAVYVFAIDMKRFLPMLTVLILAETVIETALSISSRFGSLAYSLKRMYHGNNASGFEILELHRREWDLAGARHQETSCIDYPLGLAAIVLFSSLPALSMLALIIRHLAIVSCKLQRCKWLDGGDAETAQFAAITTGVAFLTIRTVIHCISFSKYPPPHIRRSADGKAIVRSLSAAEKQRDSNLPSPSTSPTSTPVPSLMSFIGDSESESV